MTSPASIDETPQSAASAAALKLQTLHAQLERMRSMLDKYSEMFYQFVLAGIIAIILMTMASMTVALRATALLIPFFVIYIGVQSAYFLTYAILARVCATGIEQRINRLLEDDVLPVRDQNFTGFMTIHFWLTGGAIIMLSAYRAWQLLPELAGEFPPLRYYFWALGAWALLNLVYLVWYHARTRSAFSC
ncbi:MAG: hypothetical protein WCF57_16675 [Pyrinomonadaceae bacterium]